MRVTIIATSLDEESKSQEIAKNFKSKLEAKGFEVSIFDLREIELPLSGHSSSWENANAKIISESIKCSTHVVFAVPIYCYGVNAAAKNIIELCNKAFTKKIISFICSAGGEMSYMSVMSFANQLMLDYRSIIVPRFAYVTASGWHEDQVTEEVDQRLDILMQDMESIRVTV